MSAYAKIAAICAGVLLLQTWNLWRGARIGRIFLGGSQYSRDAFPRIYRAAVILNLIWAGIVVILLAFCLLKAGNIVR
jgi:hypothetical protein